MGLSIEEKFNLLEDEYVHIVGKYYMLRADYEARLKADLVVMLEELKKEIEELDFFEGEEPVNITQELMEEVKNWEYGVKDCKKLIQEKINKLKGEEDGKID